MAVVPVLLDACVLYPMPLRDTLLRAAEAGLYRPHWSEEILEETTRNLMASGRMDAEKAGRFRTLLEQAFPDAMTAFHIDLLAILKNDPKDRHVLAAAIASGASVIVTTNLRHFPAEALTHWQVEAQHPDQFLVHLYDWEPDTLIEIISQQSQDLRRPPVSVPELLAKLQSSAPVFVSRLQEAMN